MLRGAIRTAVRITVDTVALELFHKLEAAAVDAAGRRVVEAARRRRAVDP